ncbi:hypothetical protein ScPMuIL_001502 [Solemya velum]
MSSRKQKGEYDGKIAGLYDMEDTIGRGHFAVVKLARHVFTGEKVAVKVIDKNKLDEVSKAHLFQEVRCMKLVQHPNVVRLYEVIDTQTKLYLILELGDGGDMYDYIMKHDGGLTETIARKYFKQIVEAIAYCHRLHVVHRDLKPENVVFFEKLGIVKLTDFGFSNMFNPGKKLETSCGSLAYSAPEILLGDSYDPPAVDVWSLGVILFMLVGGCPPFQEANDSETLTMIMDCKYHVPHHVTDTCRDLISKLLKRDPKSTWQMTSTNYVIQKMVDGAIASKDEILQSLEKNAYDHIAATYYLLAERRLKRQQDSHNAVGQGNQRKLSAPDGNKPHLEPLALSPRYPRQIKKTRTAPLTELMDKLAPIAEPDMPTLPSPNITKTNHFVKTITDTMTLDRKNKKKSSTKTDLKGSLSPRTIARCLGGMKPVDPPTITEPANSSHAKQKQSRFSKIAILSSFFERKAAAAASKVPSSDWKKGFFDLPNFARLKVESNIQTKDAEQKPDQRRPKPSFVQSLVSPPGTHPSPSSSSPQHSLSRSPERYGNVRKYSLIMEESFEDEEDMDEDTDARIGYELRPTKSAEDLDDVNKSTSQVSIEPPSLRRPLISVASSPQLLNQICEENESDEEDDIVPSKLSSPRLRLSRSGIASPEALKKYEQRKKRRAGQRGASCSSSDASDTDDTESRSRKEKLKHKFAHRRDSSDHSSDTDGGPNGGNFGGSNFNGGSSSGGGGSSNRDRNNDKNDKNDKGSGKGKKNNKDGGQGSRHHHNNFNKCDQSSKRILSMPSELSVISAVSSLSLNSVASKNSQKYIFDKENAFLINGTMMIDESDIERLNQLNSRLNEARSKDFSDLSDYEYAGSNRDTPHNTVPKLTHRKGKSASQKLKLKMDINSNSFCKVENSHVTQVKVGSKCCSLV